MKIDNQYIAGLFTKIVNKSVNKYVNSGVNKFLSTESLAYPQFHSQITDNLTH